MLTTHIEDSLLVRLRAGILVRHIKNSTGEERAGLGASLVANCSCMYVGMNKLFWQPQILKIAEDMPKAPRDADDVKIIESAQHHNNNMVLRSRRQQGWSCVTYGWIEIFE